MAKIKADEYFLCKGYTHKAFISTNLCCIFPTWIANVNEATVDLLVHIKN